MENWSEFRHDPEIADGEFLLELSLATNPVPPPHMWNVPTYVPYVHADLTDDMIRKAEEKLGVTLLPKLLIEMFKQQHGGSHTSSVSLRDVRYLRKRYSITSDYLFGISDDETKPNMVHAHQWRIWRDAKEKAKAAGKEEVGTDEFDTPPKQFELLVPIAGDQCHFYYCLDYRRDGPHAEPRVTYIDVECQTDSEVAISLTALVQRFKTEGLPGEDSLVGSALIKAPPPLKDRMAELLERVKADAGGAGSKLPHRVVAVTTESFNYRGAAEEVEVMRKAPQGIWIRASSCLTFERQETNAEGHTVFSGDLVHSMPEYSDATYIVNAPREVFERIMQVLPSMPNVEVLWPPARERSEQEGGKRKEEP